MSGGYWRLIRKAASATPTSTAAPPMAKGRTGLAGAGLPLVTGSTTGRAVDAAGAGVGEGVGEGGGEGSGLGLGFGGGAGAADSTVKGIWASPEQLDPPGVLVSQW